ncbi:hypothetical protein QBC38DRAFT_536526 [Podospora fimiseda]|uniref:FAD-binding domain-containing protein n=1 Tax=Podospora fimiseda TaxID=252190 RepID=A0AAN7GYZ5_9PEZI|nr:hypothetical protein QBC38DRAFT_536526 [Podospora fimiseda]
MAEEKKFSVIIVGAGPVGLTAAHALSKAGIDFTILEKRETVEEDIGATIILMPHGLRVLFQLGLEETLREEGSEFQNAAFQTIADAKVTKYTFFPRAKLISLLYNSLPGSHRSRILTNKKVSSIITNPDSSSDISNRVTVTCSDGTSYSSTIIIGADGIHSQVRQAMYSEPSPFKANYRILWFSIPRPDSIPSTSGFEAHGKDFLSQCLNTKEESFMIVYQRIPSHLKPPITKHVVYTEKDIEDLAKECGSTPLGESGLTLKDVWHQKLRPAGMANLEEGVLKKWSCGKGKIVLVGDAAHKITPNQGLGLNDGIMDVVGLVNELRKVKDGEEEGELQEAFNRYQNIREGWAIRDMQTSGFSLELGSWKKGWLVWRVLTGLMGIPGVEGFLLGRMYNELFAASGLVLEGEGCEREEGEFFEGRVKWVYSIPRGEGKGGDE